MHRNLLGGFAIMLIVAATGCSADTDRATDSDDEVAKLCSVTLTYQGQTYDPRAVEPAVRAGKTLGPAQLPNCRDAQQAADKIEVTLAEVDGVPPEVALAVVGEGDMWLPTNATAVPKELEDIYHFPTNPSFDPSEQPSK